MIYSGSSITPALPPLLTSPPNLVLAQTFHPLPALFSILNVIVHLLSIFKLLLKTNSVYQDLLKQSFDLGVIVVEKLNDDSVLNLNVQLKNNIVCIP